MNLINVVITHKFFGTLASLHTASMVYKRIASMLADIGRNHTTKSFSGSDATTFHYSQCWLTLEETIQQSHLVDQMQHKKVYVASDPLNDFVEYTNMYTNMFILCTPTWQLWHGRIRKGTGNINGAASAWSIMECAHTHHTSTMIIFMVRGLYVLTPVTSVHASISYGVSPQMDHWFLL